MICDLGPAGPNVPLKTKLPTFACLWQLALLSQDGEHATDASERVDLTAVVPTDGKAVRGVNAPGSPSNAYRPKGRQPL